MKNPQSNRDDCELENIQFLVHCLEIIKYSPDSEAAKMAKKIVDLHHERTITKNIGQ